MNYAPPTKIDRTGVVVVTAFGIFFAVLALGVILAPVFEHFGLHFLSKTIYFIGGFLCHQMYTRSIHIFDLQVAVCTRDLFMYITMMLSAFITVRYNVRRLPFVFAVLLIMPAAIDGSLQLISSLGWIGNFIYYSNNLVRAITGSLYGLGLGFFLFPLLLTSKEQKDQGKIPARL